MPTVYTGLSVGSAIVSPVLEIHTGQAAFQFLASNGSGGESWYGFNFVPPPAPPATADMQLTWETAVSAYVDVVTKAFYAGREIRFQPVVGGTVPCDPNICGPSATAIQAANVSSP